MVVDWTMREKAADFWTALGLVGLFLLVFLLKTVDVFFFALVNLWLLVLCINFIFFSEITLLLNSLVFKLCYYEIVVACCEFYLFIFLIYN